MRGETSALLADGEGEEAVVGIKDIREEEEVQEQKNVMLSSWSMPSSISVEDNGTKELKVISSIVSKGGMCSAIPFTMIKTCASQNIFVDFMMGHQNVPSVVLALSLNNVNMSISSQKLHMYTVW